VITLTDSGPDVTESHIKQFEALIGATLPSDYRDFLLTTNGGIPYPSAVAIPDCNELVGVDLFLALNSPVKTASLEWCYDRADDKFSVTANGETEVELSEHFLSIGRDPGGAYFCIKLHAPVAGTNWYYENSGFLERFFDDVNTVKVSDSFSNLLESLFDADKTS